jgi:hypothetical protein
MTTRAKHDPVRAMSEEQQRQHAAATVALSTIPVFTVQMLAGIFGMDVPPGKPSSRKVSTDEFNGYLFDLIFPGFWLFIVPYHGTKPSLVRLGFGEDSYVDIQYSWHPGDPMLDADDFAILAGFAALNASGSSPSDLEARFAATAQRQGTGTTMTHVAPRTPGGS